MTESFGFSDSVSYYITKSAGIGEVLFGVLLFIFYRSKSIVILNIIGLIGLLLFVAVLQPQLLNNPSVSVLVFKQNGDVVYSKQYG
uniref:DoxX-like family protein n=1 Tax=Pseudoalteromonas sp. S16_S37 TaxID=2720228 RepID=UPI001EEE02AD|nr:DoxX-like family protein [Pseudoalteromonas sp. S16_S37]